MSLSDFRENLGEVINVAASTVHSIIPVPEIIKPFAAAYGLVTGTEFSGSGVHRSLTAAWNEKMISLAVGRTIGPPTEESLDIVHDRVMQDSEQLRMSEGLSRRDAQLKALGLWQTI
jgi:hypothetical protein